jgi:cellulose synthase/poly-beta-1,6-N-acetylglucosamine synthase-like glycosyltransferase
VEPAFWLAAAVVLYSWLVYPALIALLASVRPAPTVRRDGIEPPPVTVVLVVRDEEGHLEGKLRNLLALDYPRDRLEVLVVSDGSTDRTESIAAGFADAGVRLLSFTPPRGKAASLNDAVPHARGDILLMTDARQALAEDALRQLVARLGDPSVGAASGELHLVHSPEGGPEGVGLYWKYEKLIRRWESRFDSTVGVTGALYAIRRELFVPLDPRAILDDVLVPMEVVLAGRRVVFAPEARAFDRIAESPSHEYRRKVRTLAGNYQLLALRPALLDPFRNRLFFQLVSHKLSRLAVPWCLLLVLLASAGLAVTGPGVFYRLALGLQLLFYGLAAAGWVGARARRPTRLTSLPYALVLLNLAAASALLGFVRGRETAAWKAAR